LGRDLGARGLSLQCPVVRRLDIEKFIAHSKEITIMKNVGANFTKWTMAIAIAPLSLLLGPVRDARAAHVSCPQNAPMVKNLRAYSSRCIGAPAVVPHQFTTKEVKRLTVTAKSANDHLTVAKYYEAEAERLDAQAAGYEEAAAGYRHSPMPKNLMSPTTAGRYDYLAQGFRKEAKSDRALAASQKQMANNSAATAEAPRASDGVTQ
jgi:hypothetical protein